MAMVCPPPRPSVKIESVAWPQLPVTPALRQREPLAQQVEHLPFKQRVAGSIPARLTNYFSKLGVHSGRREKGLSPILSPNIAGFPRGDGC